MPNQGKESELDERMTTMIVGFNAVPFPPYCGVEEALPIFVIRSELHIKLPFSQEADPVIQRQARVMTLRDVRASFVDYNKGP